MRAGDLVHTVVLQSPAGSRDSVGERTTTWTDVATVRASIRPLDGREAFIAAQRQASTTHKVKIRYSSEIAAIDASWRVLFGSRVLVLDAPPANVDEQDREFELSCVEGLRQE